MSNTVAGGMPGAVQAALQPDALREMLRAMVPDAAGREIVVSLSEVEDRLLRLWPGAGAAGKEAVREALFAQIEGMEDLRYVKAMA